MDNRDSAEQFNDLADEYEDNLADLLRTKGGDDIEKYAIYKIELARQLIRKEPEKILDFGCGTGRSIPYLKEFFPNAELFGCDVSEESLKIAADELKEDHVFINNSAEELKGYGQTYDAVFLACVLHHIEPTERKYWLDAICDVLNPGGYIFIFEHNAINPMTKSIILDPINRVDRLDWMLNQKELKELTSKAEVFWSGYTLFSPFRFSGILKVECALKWLPLGAQQCTVYRKRD